MALRAKKPEAVEKRLKLFLFGSYKVGKSTAAIHFPDLYAIDGENGLIHDQYRRLLEANRSVVMQTNDVDDVIEEIRSLGADAHAYRTVLIDPVTTIEADLIEKAEKEYGPGDMRIWAKRDRKLKRLVNLLNRLDMNVIVTAHGKIDYGQNMTRLGTTFDGWKRWPYEFDLIVELERRGPDRVAIVRGSRIETFADGEVFPWSYEEFKRRYPVIDRAAVPIVLATVEQVGEIKQLVGVVKLPEDTIDKWFSKAKVDRFEDMPGDALAKCIAFVKAQLPKESTSAVQPG